MIELPDFAKMYEYETYFHLTLNTNRLGKLAAHYEAYQMRRCVPGAIVECGVYKGTSLARFAIMRDLFDNAAAAKIIGFDVFSDEYPDTTYEEDRRQREEWIREAGPSSISKEQLETVFARLGVCNFELIAGDVLETLPAYVRAHPELKVSLLNIDIDFVEPTLCTLQELYDRVMPGGVILLDNYGAFHGDTKGVDRFFQDKAVSIKRFPFVARPCYIVKEQHGS
jgi:hypothetical protein